MKNIREGYKMTELGEIPTEWKIVTLSDLSKRIGDGLHGTPKYVENSEYYFINGNNLVDGKIELYEDTKMVSKEDYIKNNKDLNKNSLLISLNGTIGNIAYYNNEKIMLGKSSGYINLNDNINKEFIYYVLKTNKTLDYFYKELTGTTIKNLSLNTLRNTPIIFPSIEEQEKISSILLIVDEQIDNVDELIEKNKELKEGLMQQLLTKGIGHTKFKKTEIGEIPEQWEVKQLGDIAQYINGKAFKPSEWDTQGLPIVRIQNLNGISEYNYYNGELDEKFIINNGQLLFSWSGSKGTSFGPYIWTNGKAVLNQHIFKVDLKEDVNRIYGYYALKQVTQIIEESAHGSAGLVHVTKGTLERFKIGVPEIEEQKKIASILSKVDEKIEIYENKKEKLEELKKGLMQQLLTGKFRIR